MTKLPGFDAWITELRAHLTNDLGWPESEARGYTRVPGDFAFYFRNGYTPAQAVEANFEIGDAEDAQ